MSWAEVKKINDNMSIPLDQLFIQFLAGGYRQYIYENQVYTVPFTGTYTIRAYCGSPGSYGKVVKQFTKGEQLTISFTGITVLTVVSNLQDTSVFHISLSRDAYVNGNSADGIKALAIGGSRGGNAYVRCNNGIAAGAGGAVHGAGGNAYAWGNNVYALGGGGRWRKYNK